MREESRRLVITDDDLLPAAPNAPRVPAMPAPTAGGLLPSVDGVKPMPLQLGAPASGMSWFGSTMGTNVIGGLLAALVAWGVYELIFGGEGRPTGDLVLHEALTTGVFALVFAGIFTAWEDVIGRAWEKAARNSLVGAAVGAVLGAISGAIGQWIYGKVVRNILVHAFETGQQISPTDIKLDLTRALAWGIFGLGIGLGAGVARRSAQKMVNALIGGLLGAAMGGFLFNFIGKATESNSASLFLGFLLIGLLLGLAVGLIEVVRRQAWIQITGGGMSGKEFILYWPNANVGSSPKAEITLIKDPGVAPFHCRIDTQGNRRSLTPYEGCPVNINGAPVSQHWLRNGDQIQIGGSLLLYSERAAAT